MNSSVEIQDESSKKRQGNILSMQDGHLHMESSNPTIQKFIDKHPTAAASIAVPIAAVTVVGAVAAAAAAVVVAVPVAIIAAPIVKACGGDVSISRNGIIYGGNTEKELKKENAIVEVKE
ncbi:hypothetical protein HDV04_005185 [Boothiomyces sp. JEL0838]|nr:hypothetical protein HDV04_005185 [Boothiomyces sp. JEL0838]